MYYSSLRGGRTVNVYVDRTNPANILTLGMAPWIVAIILAGVALMLLVPTLLVAALV